MTIVAPADHAELDSVSDGVRTFEAASTLVVSAMGIVGNVMTILAVVFCRKLHAVPNVYVVNLAVADLLITAVVCPMSAYSSLASTKEIHCEFLGAVTLMLLVLSVYTMGAIAVNRYILICRSRELYLRVYGRRNVALSLAAVWLISLAIVLPPMFGLGSFDYHVKLRGCFFTAYDFRSYAYGVSFLSFGTLLPNFTFTLFAYVKIIRRFRRTQSVFLRTHRHPRYPGSPLTSSLSSGDSSVGGGGVGGGGGVKACGGGALPPVSWHSEADGCADSEAPISGAAAAGTAPAMPAWQHNSVSIGKDLKVTLNLLVVFVVFVACWMPVASVFVGDYYGRLPSTLYSVLMILAYSNSALNVFLYAGMNPTYRRAYKNILLCRWKALTSAV